MTVQVVILAAGTGSRLWPLTKDTPKPLLEIGDGTCILERQVSALETEGLSSRIAVVTGHRADRIEEFLEHRVTVRVETVYNPFYSQSGPIGSLWVARSYLRVPFILMNGDTAVSHSALARLMQAAALHPSALLVSRIQKPTPDDVVVDISDDGRVLGVGKELPYSGVRSAGIFAAFSAEACQLFFSSVISASRDPDALRVGPWHNVLASAITSGLHVDAVEIASSDWVEVDLHPDLETLQRIVRESSMSGPA